MIKIDRENEKVTIAGTQKEIFNDFANIAVAVLSSVDDMRFKSEETKKECLEIICDEINSVLEDTSGLVLTIRMKGEPEHAAEKEAPDAGKAGQDPDPADQKQRTIAAFENAIREAEAYMRDEECDPEDKITLDCVVIKEMKTACRTLRAESKKEKKDIIREEMMKTMKKLFDFT